MFEGKIIDLSHEITNFTYPGDPEFELNPLNVETYTISEIKLGSHISTHIDYPKHVGIDNNNIEGDFKDIVIGTGFCVNIKNLGEFLNQLHAYKTRKIDILLINTNISKYWGRKEYFEKEINIEPHLDDILNINPKAVGVDCASIGNYEVHKELLSKGIFIIENLNNLEKLENKYFTFMGLPLKIRGIDGAPIRAISFIENLK